mmetsp:Transcript_42402/g.62357  ORF Transcript_42402/g.62357 Transcript_42402/m.62357 type:complete len:134 (+) Transcript_42402:201-602(+)
MPTCTYTGKKKEKKSEACSFVSPRIWPVCCVACSKTPRYRVKGAGGGGGREVGGGGGRHAEHVLDEEEHFLRDRMTRSVVACSSACAQSPVAKRAVAKAFKSCHLPPAAEVDADEGTLFQWAPADLWTRIEIL